MSDRTPKPDTVTYLLRNVPAASWRAAQARADAEGLTVRVVLLQALSAYGAALPAPQPKPCPVCGRWRKTIDGACYKCTPPKTKKSPRRPK